MSSETVEALHQEMLIRHRVEEELRHSESRLKQAQHLARIGFWEWDIASDVTTWSAEMFAMYGIKPEEFTGKGQDYINFTHPEDRQIQRDNIQQAFRHAAASATPEEAFKPNPNEFRIIRPDKSVCYVRGDAVAIVDDDGAPIRMLGILMDVTAEKLREKALQDSEQRLLNLIQGSIQGILVHRNTKALFVNSAYAQILGYETPDRILALESVVPLIAPYDRPRLLDYHQARLSNGSAPTQYEYDAVRRDGSIVTLEQIVSIINWSGEPAVLATIVDVTKRKKAELALQQSEARLNGIIASTMDAIIVIDENQEIILFNPTAERVFGHKAEDILGQSLARLIPDRFREVHEEHIRVFGRTGVTNRQMGIDELYGLHADNTEFPIEASISQLEVNDKRFYTAILRDITQRKKLEAQFFQAQKMEAIGQLAGGVAHEFNNLLVPIMMYADMGMMQLTPGSLQYQYLEEIQKTAEKAKQVAQQILTLSRKQMLAIELLDINHVVKDMGQVLRQVIGEDITLELLLGDGLPVLQADHTQLSQVMMNLAINGRDAMPNGGMITISTEKLTVTERLAGQPEDVEPGTYVCLSLKDTGSGMDDATKLNLFDPFYTTKEPGRGTGLGLTTVQSIVKKHRGFIQFESEPHVGTTFRLYFPPAPRTKPRPKQTHSPGAEFVGGSETILLVEDAEAVRTPLKQALHIHGYKVLEAKSGQNALQIAATYPQEIHLLLTDVMMPLMNGPELRRQLVEMLPTIKVLYMTGYSGDAVERVNLDSDVDVLQKPFSVQQLIQKVVEILRGSAG